MNEEMKTALEELRIKLVGKSKEEVQKEIKAFEEKYNALIEQKVKELVGDEVKTVKEQLEKERDEKLKTIQDHLDKVDIRTKGKKGISGENVVEELKSKKEAIEKVAKGQAGEVEIKTLVTRGSIADNASGFFLPDIGQLGVKERSLYNVLPKIPVNDSNNSGTIRYRDWDEDTVNRAAAMVAEGAAFPESTAAWQWYSKDLRKIGDTLPVTEEFFEDEQQAFAELDAFLNINVNLVVDNQLVNGNNTGQDLDGVLNAALAFTAVASGISAPNLKDLVIKVRNGITRDRGSKYRPDMVLMASSTMEDLVLDKNANNNYIFDENLGTIGGLAVVIDENMPDNQIVVGDRRYARIYEKTGVILSRGTVNAQFTEDEMTLKARKRMLLLIREVDKTGFLKVTDVDAALVALGS